MHHIVKKKKEQRRKNTTAMAMIPSTFSDIPQHIAEEIMQRFPVKAILRLRGLSKHYYSYMTSFCFIYAHYLLSSLRPSLIFPLHSHPWIVNFNVSNITNKETPTNLVIAPPFPTSYQTRVVSCCFGLVCVSLSTFYTKVVVWNPATREFRILPESTVDVGRFLRTRTIIKICLGFGFDREFKEYKVVRIVYHLFDTDSFDLNVEVEIFRRSAATWESVDLDLDGVTNGFDMEETKIKDCVPTAVVNGVIYWNAVDEDPYNKYQHFIVAFDILDETFRRVPLPLACKSALYWCVLQWENSIATFVPQKVDHETLFDVWMMTNDEGEGGGEPWIRVMSVGPFPDTTYPIMACNGHHGKIVMNTKKKGKISSELMVYYMKTQQSKNLEIEGAHNVYKVHRYVESLVSVYGDEGNEAHA